MNFIYQSDPNQNLNCDRKTAFSLNRAEPANLHLYYWSISCCFLLTHFEVYLEIYFCFAVLEAE